MQPEHAPGGHEDPRESRLGAGDSPTIAGERVAREVSLRGLCRAPRGAEIYDVSLRHFHVLHAQERIPRSICFGKRCVRWIEEELLAHVAAGAPPRERWEQMPEASRWHAARRSGGRR